MKGDSYKGLLFARYSAVNMLGVILLLIAWRHGLVAEVWEADTSHLSVLIAALFLWAAAVGGWRAWKLSGALDQARAGAQSLRQHDFTAALARGIDPRLAADVLRTKLLERVAFLKHVSGMLVTLGLIGTVVGFIIALGGVNPRLVGDVAAIGPMVAKLIEGMGVALYTTLVGASFAVWTTVNHRILVTGASNLYATILEAVPCSTRIPAQSSAT